MKISIDRYTKQALWEAHKKRCFYCGESLSFNNIQVDHVIPVIAFEGQEQEIRNKYNLDSQFHFNSLDNYVPACQGCNTTRKRDIVSKNGIPIWLNEVLKSKEIVIKRAAQLKHELSLDLPDQYKEFFLSSPDFSLSDLSLETIRKTDIEKYKHLAFKPGYFPLTLVSPDGQKETELITNLSQYEKYRDQGYYGRTTPAIGLASACDACLDFFEVFEKAVALDNKIDLKDYFRLLPCKLLHVIGPEEDFNYRKFNSIGDYLDANSNVTTDISDNSIRITIHHPQFNEREIYIFQEVLQANFSGGQDREAIIFVYYKSGGTFHISFASHAKEVNGQWSTLKWSD